MPTAHRKQDFFESPEGIALKAKLVHMDTSEGYQTKASYSPNSDLYEDNLIPFVDKHLNYIRSHPSLDPDQYIANLQILTRVR